MAGIVMAVAGIILIAASTLGFIAAQRYLKRRKLRIKEVFYQFYD